MEENTQNEQKRSTQEVDEHLTEHNYDGIQELDNPPPRWIMMIFYLTIGFSIIYAAYFFWLDVGDHQDARYVKKSEMHEARYQLASRVRRRDDGPDRCSRSRGRQEDLQGNELLCLSRNEWEKEMPLVPILPMIPGSMDVISRVVFNIIKNGNPAKGMTAFKTQLSDTRIQKVASYVVSLKGSNPPNAKGPTGGSM